MQDAEGVRALEFPFDVMQMSRRLVHVMSRVFDHSGNVWGENEVVEK